VTAVLPARVTVVDGLPPMPVTAEPVILPGLLTGIGVTPPVPRWATDLDFINDILTGHTVIPEDLNPQEGP
jgi:hypothetical protein